MNEQDRVHRAKQLQYELGEPADPLRVATEPLYVLGGLVVLGVLFVAVREVIDFDPRVAAARDEGGDDE